MAKTQGRCLCGAVSFEYDGPAIWRGHCHCESCRRATSAPFTTFIGVPKAACHFTGSDPAVYRSSPGVKRLFCASCGSPIAYLGDRWPDEIHLYAATLAKPQDIAPEFHVHWSERLPWIELADSLPKYDHSGG